MAYYGKAMYLIIASILSLLILWDYVRRGTVPLALRKIAKSDFASAKKVIAYTTSANRLTSAQQAGFYFVHGLIKHHEDQFEEATADLEKALLIGLPNNNSIALSYITLADIAIIHKKRERAKEYLYHIRDMKINQNLIPLVRKLQSYLGII